MPEVRARFWVAVGTGIACLILLVATLITREWVELLFGVDPDQGSGALEWLLVIGFGAVSATSLGLARWEWRRPNAAPANR